MKNNNYFICISFFLKFNLFYSLFYYSSFSCFFGVGDYFFYWMVIVMSILLDWMSLLFMMFVLMTSSSVIYYSKSYMNSELKSIYYFSFMICFFYNFIYH